MPLFRFGGFEQGDNIGPSQSLWVMPAAIAGLILSDRFICTKLYAK